MLRSPPTTVLMLTRYDRQGASSRLRTLQYVPYIENDGINVVISSFFDGDYLSSFYSSLSRRGGTLPYLLRRLRQMRHTADIVWIEKEALPWCPWPIERLAYPSSVPIISDYDDAVFHRYDQHRAGTIRRLLGRKIDGVMAHSDVVFAGNDYLRARAQEAGANRVELVPTVVDMDTYRLDPKPASDGKPRIGWIGTPETWAKFGVPIQVMLNDAASEHGAIFRAVGAGGLAEALPSFEILDWSEETEVGLIQGMDIGIMPLPDTPWARGKCGYKLIQYMACGLPVVASPVGVNSQIVEHGVNGFLVTTEADWRAALSTLLGDPDLRRRMGLAGRRKVEAEYSLQVYGPKVAKLIAALAQAGRRKAS